MLASSVWLGASRRTRQVPLHRRPSAVSCLLKRVLPMYTNGYPNSNSAWSGSGSRARSRRMVLDREPRYGSTSTTFKRLPLDAVLYAVVTRCDIYADIVSFEKGRVTQGSSRSGGLVCGSLDSKSGGAVSRGQDRCHLRPCCQRHRAGESSESGLFGLDKTAYFVC